MIVLLSPAKTLDYSPQTRTKKHTIPDFLEDSETLVEKLRKMNKAKLAELMGISDKLAQLNVDRYREWSLPFTTQNAKQAILAFQGDVYQGFTLDEWKAADFNFAQKHVRILSGLYGILRPLDLMQPYRLEMGTKLKTPQGRDLYEFWAEKLTDVVNQELETTRSRALVNLASNEYFHAVDPKSVQTSIVTPVFKDEKNGKYKIISFYAKKARGMMADFIVRHRIKKTDDLRSFDTAGYRFDPSSSDEQNMVFLRDEA